MQPIVPKTGRPVFNYYSCRIGTLQKIVPISKRHGRYASDLAIVKIIEGGRVIRRARWRFENCRPFTPSAHRSRQAFLLLARTIGVSPQRLSGRRPLSHFGFTRERQRAFRNLLRRRLGIRLSAASTTARMTCTQVIDAARKAPMARS